MDDIRRPQPNMPRRDYTTQPVRRPMGPVPAQPASRPIPIQVTQPPAQPYNQPVQTFQQPVFERPAPAPAPPAPPVPQPKPKSSLFKKTKRTLAVTAAAAVAAGLFAGGYVLKSSGSANTLPTGVVKQAKFNVYFPSPMPAGYTYMKDTATFQIGEVFYKFANGAKRVTVREEPIGSTKPNLGLLTGYQQFASPAGKAAIGSTFGQPTAVIVAGTTVITMNSTGGVTQGEMQAAISSLKNIGQNTQKK